MEKLDTFIYEEKEIELANGGTVKVPPLSWGKELKVIKIIGDTYNRILKSNSEILSTLVANGIKNYQETGETGIDITFALGNILSLVPDALTKICSILTGKSEKFINEKMVLEDVMNICLPFLEILFKKIMKIAENNMANIIQVVEETKE